MLEEYRVFQKNRNGSVGGLVTAGDLSLSQMLISTKNDQAEILTVQVEIGTVKLRVVNAYGPQEADEESQHYKSGHHAWKYRVWLSQK